MASVLSTIIELAGFAVIAAGCWMLAPWLGVLAAGVGLVLVGYAISAPRPPRKPNEHSS